MQTELLEGRGPGHWQRILVKPDGAQPRWSAIVWCPACGRVLDARNHHIGADGQITPSLGHPASYPPCGWHVLPKLLGWSPLPSQGP